MQIQSIPMWSDNYAYLVKDGKSKTAAIVDPAEPSSVIPVLEKAISSGEIDLKYIITTHHHRDHAGGNKEILAKFPDLKVIGGKDCACVQHVPAENETFQIGAISVKSIHTPCHTQDSICFLATQDDEKAVFTGDTLFIAGCGRFFEGTPSEMRTALTKLSSLPDDTITYPGHEYTASNVKFATTILSSNDALKGLAAKIKEGGKTCGRFTIAQERQWNPFMRLSDPETIKSTGEEGGEVSVMAKLRELKNNA